jgi:hypothetical protein
MNVIWHPDSQSTAVGKVSVLFILLVKLSHLSLLNNKGAFLFWKTNKGRKTGSQVLYTGFLKMDVDEKGKG